MKKIRAFLDSMEERFVFPIGRRTFQINALIGLTVLGLSIIWLIFNSTPTGRDDVSISKSEVIQNQVDTSTVVSAPVVSTCEQSQYNLWLDSLKKDLPSEEWVKLGDSIDVVQDSYSDYSEYSEYADTAAVATSSPATIKTFVPNPAAIPSMLNEVYAKRGIDSADYCGKIAVIEAMHFLIKKTSTNYLKEAYPQHFYILTAYPNAVKEDFANTFVLQSGIELKDISIDDQKSINLFYDYLRFYMEERPSKLRVDLAVNLLKEHAKLASTSSKDRDDYFKVASLIIGASLEDEELKKALDGYIGDLDYYSQNGLYTTLRKYINLYGEKLAMAIAKQNEEKAQKTAQQLTSLMSAGGAFVGILLVAILLLLFSIQSLLKKHVDK
jgi:hypothetical protein